MDVINTIVMSIGVLGFYLGYKRFIAKNEFILRKEEINNTEVKMLLQEVRKERDFYRADNEKLNEKLSKALVEIASLKKENKMLLNSNSILVTQIDDLKNDITDLKELINKK